MKPKAVKIFSILMIAAFIFSACGGTKDQNSSEIVSEKAATAKASEQKILTPAEMGENIGDIYEKAMKELTELLKEKPEAAQVKSQVEQLKEAYIQQLIALGKQREALEAAGRSAVDTQLRMKMNSSYNAPWYTAFNEIQQHYFSDRDFHKIIVSFNIITQYANFDLLKKQEPEEALRLGIE